MIKMWINLLLKFRFVFGVLLVMQAVRSNRYRGKAQRQTLRQWNFDVLSLKKASSYCTHLSSSDDMKACVSQSKEVENQNQSNRQNEWEDLCFFSDMKQFSFPRPVESATYGISWGILPYQHRWKSTMFFSWLNDKHLTHRFMIDTNRILSLLP